MARKGPTPENERKVKDVGCTNDTPSIPTLDIKVKEHIQNIIDKGDLYVKQELLNQSSFLAINALRNLEYFQDLSTTEAKNAVTTTKVLIDIYKTLVAIDAGIIKDTNIDYEY